MQKKISTLVGIIIIVVIVVIAFGGVFAYQYFSKSQIAGPAPSNVEGWKTYANTEYGFEVQYPPNGFFTGDQYGFPTGYYIVEIRIPSPQSFMIDISPQKNCLNFNANAANIYFSGVPAIKSIKIVSGGQEYRDVTLKTLSEGEEYRNVTFVKGESCYSINLIGPGFENSEKMLTTFKFTK